MMFSYPHSITSPVSDVERQFSFAKKQQPLSRSSNTGCPKKRFTSKRFWELHGQQVNKEEQELIQEWAKTAEHILIFSGIFSAVTTSFILEGYRNLQPDPTERLIDIMTTVSVQLFALHNGSEVAPAYASPDQFRPQLITVWMNGLWLSSLAFSLVTALLGALLNESTRSYQRSISRYRSPDQRRKVRTYMFTGLTKWRMSSIVDVIPGLVEITLVLFLGGLILFIWDLYQPLAAALFAIMGIIVLIYVITSFIPLFIYDFPYRTSLSQWLLYLSSGVLSLLRAFKDGGVPTYPERRLSAAKKCFEKGLLQAFSFVATAVDQDKELEQVAESFPGLVEGLSMDGNTQVLTELSSTFISSYAHSITRRLTELYGSTEKDAEKTSAAVLRALSSAIIHVDSEQQHTKIKCLISEFDTFLAFFGHRNSEVAREAMTLYAHLGSIESGQASLGPDALPTVGDLERVQDYSHPTISWKMIMACFVTTDEHQAAFTRKKWPEVYKAFAGLQSNDTTASGEEDKIPKAFAAAAAVLVPLIAPARPKFGKLVADIIALVRALDEACQWDEKTMELNSELYGEFRQLRGGWQESKDIRDTLDSSVFV